MNFKKFLARHIVPLIFLGVVLLYFLIMFGYPILKSEFPAAALSGSNFVHLREFWNKWQSLNGGIIGGLLTVLASIIAFYLLRKHEENKAKNTARFAKAALTVTLSEFFAFFNESASLLISLWNKASVANDASMKLIGDADFNPPNLFLPQLPEYKDTFRSFFIDLDNEEICEYLASFIEKLQIFTSRLRSTAPSAGTNGSGTIRQIFIPSNIWVCAIDLAELHAMASKLMYYARVKKSLYASEFSGDLRLRLEDFTSAFSLLDLEDLEEDSEGFITRVINARLEADWKDN